MDIAAWLRSLGLEQYEPAFRDNDIDAELVPRLTVEDLKDLGIVSVGHRRKLLDAIAALNNAAGRSDSLPVDPGQHQRRRFSPIDHSSRRRNVASSPSCSAIWSARRACSNRLDPEEYRGIIAAFQQACADIIGRFDGFLAKYMGDGVLAYFGYPQTHEDEASRAVHAGLALVEDVTRLALPAGLDPLHARVGIATGLVVVGDLIGAGSAQEQSVAGETPNLAARLQALAPPDGVVIAANNPAAPRKRVPARGSRTSDLKGFAAPVPAWRVLGTRVVESRFEALARGASSADREERKSLGSSCAAGSRPATERVRRSCSRVKPGIGKSRLVRGLLDRLQSDGVRPGAVPMLRALQQFASASLHGADRTGCRVPE